MIRRALAVVIVLIAVSVASAKNLYVNNSGAPACSENTTYANNTAALPWCSIGRALWGNAVKTSANSAQAATAGDVVLVTPGLYSAGTGSSWGTAPSLYPINSGTLSNPITIRKNGVGVFEVRIAAGTSGSFLGTCGSLEQSNCGAGRGDYQHPSDYIIWDGVYVDQTSVPTAGASGGVITFWGCLGCQLLNSEVKGDNIGSQGINHAGVYMQYNSGMVVRNNYIHDLRMPSGGNAEGILIYDTSDTLFEHNLLQNNGSGIYPKGAVLGVQDNLTIRFNWFVGNEEGMEFSYHPSGNPGQDLIYQNVFDCTGGGVGIYFWGDLQKVRFVNNTLYNCNTALTSVRHVGDPVVWVSMLWRNNILQSVSDHSAFSFGTVDAGVDVSAFDGDYDLAYNFTDEFGSLYGVGYPSKASWVAQTGDETNTLTSNPLLVNPSGGDFRICRGNGNPTVACTTASPAINSGRDILDLNANGSTTDTITMGAYITGTEIIGIDTNCGNGTIEEPEQCDGANLNSHTCAEFGCSGGTPTCASCTITQTGCTGCGATTGKVRGAKVRGVKVR